MTYIYLTVQEVKAIHEDQIRRFGGLPGLKSESGLASAVARPQTGYYNSIVEEATALMESLATNHAFNDGNKRVSFFAADAFLRLNGFFIDCDADEAYSFYMQWFEASSGRFAQLHLWLENCIKPLDTS